MLSGHSARPTDFCWAPGEPETWTLTSASEDNIVMVWAPTMRVWAGEEVRVDENELEPQPMEDIEETGSGDKNEKEKRSNGKGAVIDS